VTFPRVLFITPCAFNHLRGSGITFSNLFQGWPQDFLATVHSDPASVGHDVCSRYYRLTKGEIHWIWPFPSGMVGALNNSNADVLQRNWICGLLSVEDIGRLTKPMVSRFSDMWPFSGAEHYGDDGAIARWRTGCRSDNRPASHRGMDIDRWAWNRKRRAWKKPIHIVAPSQWMSDCAKMSALMHDWPISVIPTAVDVNQFKPWPKAFAREVLMLPKNAAPHPVWRTERRHKSPQRKNVPVIGIGQGCRSVARRGGCHIWPVGTSRSTTSWFSASLDGTP
jgi:hypothetical protein